MNCNKCNDTGWETVQEGLHDCCRRCACYVPPTLPKATSGDMGRVPMYTLDDCEPFTSDEFLRDNADNDEAILDTYPAMLHMQVGEVLELGGGAQATQTMKRVS